MAINYQDDYAYANERLSGSIVKLEDTPVMIDSINGRGVANYSRSRFGRGHATAHLRDFDLSPINLGYMNITPDACYVMRMPARVYKQGIRDNVLTRRVDLQSSCFINCVQNKYPDLDTVMDILVNGELQNLSFNKRFAVQALSRGRFNLYYKGKNVGKIDKMTKEVELKESFAFLKDVYERAVA